jgi:hypothetical protein
MPEFSVTSSAEPPCFAGGCLVGLTESLGVNGHGDIIEAEALAG